MNEQPIIHLPAEPCAICRKNEATQLCDFVVEYAWFSKPDIPNQYTCDLPMCHDCSARIAGHDFCDFHKKMLGHLRNPDPKRKKRTQQNQVRLFQKLQLQQKEKNKS